VNTFICIHKREKWLEGYYHWRNVPKWNRWVTGRYLKNYACRTAIILADNNNSRIPYTLICTNTKRQSVSCENHSRRWVLRVIGNLVFVWISATTVILYLSTIHKYVVAYGIIRAILSYAQPIYILFWLHTNMKHRVTSEYLKLANVKNTISCHAMPPSFIHSCTHYWFAF